MTAVEAPANIGQPQTADLQTCPLCAAPITGQQDWCLRCGTAARTRLAAPVNWRVPLIILAIVIVLSLGVLAAALVKLAGKPSATKAAPTAPTATLTSAPATEPTISTIPSTATTTGPASTTPPAGATQSKTGAVAPPGALTPGSSSGTTNQATSTVKP